MKKFIAFATVVSVIVGCTTTQTTLTPSTPSSQVTTVKTVEKLVSTTEAQPAVDSDETLKNGTLYARLGGIKAIRAVTDKLAENVVADARISKFFTVLSQGRLVNLKQRVVEQLCMATGGPCIYTGEEMPETHRTLNISGSEFDAFMEDAAKTLDQLKVPTKEKGEVAAALASMKEMIINK